MTSQKMSLKSLFKENFNKEKTSWAKIIEKVQKSLSMFVVMQISL